MTHLAHQVIVDHNHGLVKAEWLAHAVALCSKHVWHLYRHCTRERNDKDVLRVRL